MYLGLLICFTFFPLAKTDKAFKAFLDARNPTKQHSSTLESFLIKPVQRVLKYPLLLKELVSLTDSESEEHYHLTGTSVKAIIFFPKYYSNLYPSNAFGAEQFAQEPSCWEHKLLESSAFPYDLGNYSHVNKTPPVGESSADLRLPEACGAPLSKYLPEVCVPFNTGII